MRVRRGPATVTGDAHRTRPAKRPQATGPEAGTGKARKGRPGSQETSLRPPSRKPSWKGVALLMKLRAAGLIAGLVSLSAAATAVAAPVTVNLRVEGADRTLYEDPSPSTCGRSPSRATARSTRATARPPTRVPPRRPRRPGAARSSRGDRARGQLVGPVRQPQLHARRGRERGLRPGQRALLRRVPERPVRQPRLVRRPGAERRRRPVRLRRRQRDAAEAHRPRRRRSRARRSRRRSPTRAAAPPSRARTSAAGESAPTAPSPSARSPIAARTT